MMTALVGIGLGVLLLALSWGLGRLLRPPLPWKGPEWSLPPEKPLCRRGVRRG